MATQLSLNLNPLPTISEIDLDEFTKALEEAEFGRHITRWWLPEYHPSVQYSSYTSKERIELPCKTYRTSAGGWDFDACGVAYPEKEAVEIVERIGKKYGLKVQWTECEKGHGWFVFQPA